MNSRGNDVKKKKPEIKKEGGEQQKTQKRGREKERYDSWLRAKLVTFRATAFD